MTGIVTKHKFSQPDNKEYNKSFEDYINYMIRDEAVTTDDVEHIALFTDYIYKKFDNKETLNHEKLFSANKDFLTDNEASELKQCFRTAQKNGSCMWQTVISFDNSWLAQNGLYDIKTGAVNVYKMHEITRKHMSVMLSNEGIEDTAIWTASIHFNTEHTHLHVAAVEPFPTRDKVSEDERKGQFKKQSILKAKSAVVNDIINQSYESTLINDIIRNKIIQGKKDNSILLDDDEIVQKFLNLHEMLPADKRFWKYNNNAMKNYRPFIDEISKAYIDKYHKDDFRQLEALLQRREENYKDAYGKADNFGSYKKHKIEDLYARLGNTVLKEIKNYDYGKKAAYLKELKKSKRLVNNFRKYNNPRLTSSSMRKLLNCLNDDYEHFKNQQQFKELEWISEHQNYDEYDY